MALLTKAPRGTADVLPSQSERWQYVEKAMRTAAQRYGYNEIRTPTLSTPNCSTERGRHHR